MIKVQWDQPGFAYDVHSLVKAFFPGEDVSVGTAPDAVDEAASLVIVGKRLERSIELSLHEGAGGWDRPCLTRAAAVDFSNRGAAKNAIKQAFYQLLSEYTHQTLPWGDLTGIRPVKIPMALLEEGKSEEFIRSCMKELYFASDEKIALSIGVAKRELSILRQMEGYQDGYSLYIGIPFCPSTCLYCSFTSYPIGLWEGQTDAYLDALEKEIAFTAHSCRDRTLHTVYIGGGTPTSLRPKQLRRLIGAVRESFDLSCCAEFTVEAGRPDSITREKLLAFRDLGVDRISINPQTMKEETLRLIGRRHTAAQAAKCFHLARELGFDNINMDLIMGLPGEGLSDVEETLRQIGELSPDSLTVHSLALKRAARLSMQWEEYRAFSYENTQQTIARSAERARQMGMEPYYLYRQKNMAGNFENVGYARPGKEGLYNILVMEDRQSVLALGAGAMTKFVTGCGKPQRVENVKDVGHYLQRVDEMIERKRKKMEEISWHS